MQFSKTRLQLLILRVLGIKPTFDLRLPLYQAFKLLTPKKGVAPYGYAKPLLLQKPWINVGLLITVPTAVRP